MASLRRQLKRFWDNISNEYYDEIHRTSRNFDKIIYDRLKEVVLSLRDHGIYLDLGGGRGRVQEIFVDSKAHIVVGDVSKAMMKNTSTQLQLRALTSYVQLDAFKIPFIRNTFDGVFSLLGDPFLLPEVFSEVFRVLKPSSFFFIALPSKTWAKNLRSTLGLSINQASFRTREGNSVETPSFVYDSGELVDTLLSTGFKHIQTGDWQPLSTIPKMLLSQDVLTTAKNLHISYEILPLITYALAYKEVEM